MEWDETKHPRDDRGRFNGNGTEYRQNESYDKIVAQGNERQRGNENTAEAAVEEKSPSIDELLGEEFKGYKGQQAVDKLMKEKRGHVKGAFHRDDIGDIDLLWGNDSLGLQHILMRRKEQGIDGKDFVSDLANVVQHGAFRKKNDRGNFEFFHKGKVAVVSPELWGNKITFLVTAFKTHSKK